MDRNPAGCVCQTLPGFTLAGRPLYDILGSMGITVLSVPWPVLLLSGLLCAVLAFLRCLVHTYSSEGNTMALELMSPSISDRGKLRVREDVQHAEAW
jgi:hypothetical protein